MNINKEKLINEFKKWLNGHCENSTPLHGDWNDTFVIQKDWIELYYDIPCGKGKTCKMRMIPITDKGKKFMSENNLDKGIIDIKLENIIDPNGDN